MKNLLAFVVLALALVLPVAAETVTSLTATAGQTVVVLTTEPCASEGVAKAHPNADLKKHMTARVTYYGRPIEACWVLNEGLVEIVDADGDSGQVPVEIFRPVDTI